MFSEEQIRFMQSLGLNFDFDNLSDDEWCTIEDAVGDRLMYDGLIYDENNDPCAANEVGEMCYSILDMLPID